LFCLKSLKIIDFNPITRFSICIFYWKFQLIIRMILDILQALDRIWFHGLFLKLQHILPPCYSLFFKSYHENWSFVTRVRVIYLLSIVLNQVYFWMLFLLYYLTYILPMSQPRQYYRSWLCYWQNTYCCNWKSHYCLFSLTVASRQYA